MDEARAKASAAMVRQERRMQEVRRRTEDAAEEWVTFLSISSGEVAFPPFAHVGDQRHERVPHNLYRAG
jgi:hypothetical protein